MKLELGIGKKEDRWKIYVLGALAVAMVYFLWPDSSGGNPSPSGNKPHAQAALPAAAVPFPEAAPDSGTTRRRANGRVAGDFRPKLRDARPENRPDLTKIDPTIKLMLLARVQNVALEGGSRNIFQFGQAAPIAPVGGPIPKVKPIIPGQTAALKPPPPANLGPPPEPSAPPIPFKYYGYSSVKGEPRKRAFFLDGDNVIVTWEGEMIKNRYKVIHVGLRSVEMEDTQFKNGKQSLPLAEDVTG